MRNFIGVVLLRYAVSLRKQIFGLTHPDLIESTIDGRFTGFNGATIINLTNGQQWKQVDTTVENYSPNFADITNVTIHKHGAFWKMKVDGISKEVTVIRKDG